MPNDVARRIELEGLRVSGLRELAHEAAVAQLAGRELGANAPQEVDDLGGAQAALDLELQAALDLELAELEHASAVDGLGLDDTRVSAHALRGRRCGLLRRGDAAIALRGHLL